MNNLQKMGGVAALIYAATFVVGLGMFVILLAPDAAGDVEPVQQLASLILLHQTTE